MNKYACSLTICLAASFAHADAPDLKPNEGHDLFHHYYKYWYNQRGSHCCDETHCRPAKAGEFRWINGGWEVNYNGFWQRINDTDMVIDDGGLGPFGSICHTADYLFCVDLPDASM